MPIKLRRAKNGGTMGRRELKEKRVDHYRRNLNDIQLFIKENQELVFFFLCELSGLKQHNRSLNHPRIPFLTPSAP